MAKITDKKAVVKKAATKKSPAKKSAVKKTAVKKNTHTAVSKKKTAVLKKQLF